MSDGNAIVSSTEDLISRLPDDLLTHILSLLPVKTVITTSVLSRRWNPLWATVPSLDLNVKDFLPRGFDLTSQTRQKANFLDFVERFLKRNRPCNIYELRLNCLDGQVSSDISTIRLVWSKVDRRDYENYPLFPGEMFRHSHSNLESWIRLAEMFKTRKLFICSNTHLLVRQRPNFSTFESLVLLVLVGSMVLNIPEGSIFPNLRFLHFECILIKGDNSVSNLINSCCPVLEELFVGSYDDMDDLNHLVITSKSLRGLHLEFVTDDIFSTSTVSGTRVDFSALRYLCLRNVLVTDNQSGGIWGGLEEAELNVSSRDDDCLFWLMNSIRHVKKLTLSDSTLKALHSCTLPIFDHLTCLEIQELDHDHPNWESLVKVLKKSPMIEDFRLEGLSYDHTTVFDSRVDLMSQVV